MTSKQSEHSVFKRPFRSVRAGRFQISIWTFRRLLSNGSSDSTSYIEKWVYVDRVCIQYSTLNRLTGRFENQTVWFPVDDLRNLARVIDQLDCEDESPPSPPGHSEAEDAQAPAGDSVGGGGK